MNRVWRIVFVTLGLVIAAAVFGGIAGALALAIAVALTDGFRAAMDPTLWIIGAWIGAALGVLLGPAAAWGFLRHVPFGRLFTRAVAGTVIGGVVCWFVAPPLALFGACIGFFTAAITMSVKSKELRA